MHLTVADLVSLMLAESWMLGAYFTAAASIWAALPPSQQGRRVARSPPHARAPDALCSS